MKLIRLSFISTFLFVLFAILPSSVHAINRIGVRQGVTGGEFYDTVTGKKVQFRGNNFYFQPGRAYYASSNPEQVLTQMKESGYNAVRVFLSYDQTGADSGGLSTQFMDDTADFLRRAAAKNIYVLPVFNNIPSKGGYYPPGYPIPVYPGTYGPNNDPLINRYFMEQTLINAKVKYVTDFINGLKARGAPLEDILGYELDNEILFSLSKEPLSLPGTQQTARGPYNMSDPVQRLSAMVDNLTKWSEDVSRAVYAADPGALTTISPFGPSYAATLGGPNLTTNTDWYFIDHSQGGVLIDFVDLHLYPWIGPLSKQMADYKISGTKKPLIMGEFGARANTNPPEDVTILRDWQVQSCQYNFQGWFTWIWDDAARPDSYSVIENDGAINKVLAPIYRADPCKAENTPLSKPGDLNGDGKIDIYDYNLLVSNFGKTGSNIVGDIDNNGKVDIYDYNVLVGNFGK